MIPDTLDFAKNGRMFRILAHPFYPIGSEDETLLRFRPIIHEELDKEMYHVVTLDSTETSDEAIDAGFQFLKRL